MHSHGTAESRAPGRLIGVMIVASAIVLGLAAFIYAPAVVQKVKTWVAVSEPLPEIRARLLREHPDETIAVHDHVLDGRRSLRVSLTNSRQADVDAEARRALALDMARLAFDSAPHAGELSLVSVQFLHSSDRGLVNLTEKSGEFEFTPEELSNGDRPSSL